MPRKNWTADEDDVLKKMYGDRKTSYEEMEVVLGVPAKTIRSRATALKFKRPRPKAYDVVEDYFDVIDTDEKAYWLGFFAADGGLIKQTLIRINLRNDDVDQLEKFRDVIAPKAEIIHDPSEERRHYLCVSCRHMADTLRRHGMSPNVKTYDLCWPSELSDDRKLAFFTGYFDGDGSLMWENRGKMWAWSVCGCETMMRQFHQFVCDILGVDVFEPKIMTGSSMLFRLRTSGGKAKAIDAAMSSIAFGMPRKRISNRVIHP